jgi:hypothetical protein
MTKLSRTLILALSLAIPFIYIVLLVLLKNKNLSSDTRLYIVSHAIFIWLFQLVLTMLGCLLFKSIKAKLFFIFLFLIFFILGYFTADNFIPF